MSICPSCREYDSKVLRTRIKDNGWLMRRRECVCEHRWTTFEIPEEWVTPRDGDDDEQ